MRCWLGSFETRPRTTTLDPALHSRCDITGAVDVDVDAGVDGDDPPAPVAGTTTVSAPGAAFAHPSPSTAIPKISPPPKNLKAPSYRARLTFLA